jgi:hypothetical protein
MSNSNSLYSLDDFQRIDLSKIESICLYTDILNPFDSKKQCKLEFSIYTSSHKIVIDCCYYYSDDPHSKIITDAKRAIINKYKLLSEALDKVRVKKGLEGEQ